jgi:hypothetical protein
LRIDAKEESKIITSQKPSQKNLKKNVSNHSGHNLETIEEDSQEEDLPQKELSKAIASSSNNFLNDSNIRHMEASAELVFEGNDNRQESLNTTPERTKLNAVYDCNLLENQSQSESEAKIRSNCLERFSCVRLEPLNKNCTIS